MKRRKTSASLSTVSPAPREAWSEVLASDPRATVYQTPAWLEAVRNFTGAKDVSRLYVLDDGRLLVLPMLQRVLAPGVSLDESYPMRSGSGGLLASGGLRASDVTHVLTDLRGTRAVSTRIRANHDTAGLWEAGRVSGVTSIPSRVEVLDLEGGFSRVWNERFKPATRRDTRKAERSKLVVERDTSARLVSAFEDLYMEWTNQRAEERGVPRRLAAWLARRREPVGKVQAVARMLEDACRIWLARYDDRPVAAMITLSYGDEAIYWRGYSNKALTRGLPANNLLLRLAIEDACESGCRWFNMGESGGVPSLIRFKQSFGATPRRGIEYRIERLPLTALENLRSRAEKAVEDLVVTRARRARHVPG